MDYILNGRTIKIPDKDIQNLQTTLELSKEEAIETWLSDNDYISDETVEELTKKAKENRITGKIHGAKAETAKKERKPREKKENPLKKEIIKAIYTAIADEITSSANTFIRNDEKYIDFTLGDRSFTINLVEHRPKK